MCVCVCVCERDPYPKLNEMCVGLFKTELPGTADDFTLCLWLRLWFQYIGLKRLWLCIVQHCDKGMCVCVCVCVSECNIAERLLALWCH